MGKLALCLDEERLEKQVTSEKRRSFLDWLKLE